MSKSIIYKFNIFYLFVIIVWPAIRSNFLFFDGAGRIEIVFSFFALIVNFRSFFKIPKVIFFWLIWIIYCVMSIRYKGFGFVEYPYHLWLPHKLLMPFIAMVVVYSSALYKYDDMIKKLFVYMLIYAIIGTAVMSLNANALKMDYGDNSISNEYLNTMIILFPISVLANKTKLINSVVLFFISLIVLYGIILSGERKALAGLFIMIIGFFLSKHTSFRPKSVLAFVFLMLMVYISADYVIDNTLAGSRLTEDYSNSDYQNNLFLKLVGNRALMYVEGFEFFLLNPITGLGLTNFIAYSVMSRHILHSEYMVQLAECGLIGFSLFLVFYGGMLFRLIAMFIKKIDRSTTLIFLSSLLAILVIGFTAWIYDCLLYFVFYGLLFAYCERNGLTKKVIKDKRRKVIIPGSIQNVRSKHKIS